MPQTRLVFVVSLVVALSMSGAVLLMGQDPVKVGPHVYKCVFENDQVRVCEVRFKPGDRIAEHSHPDHFLYVLSPGKIRISPRGGQPAEADFKPGQVVWIPAEAHSAVNIGTTDARLLVVELKGQPGPVESALMQMEREWAQALVSGDMSTMDRIVASDWILTDPEGHKITKAESMEQLKSGVLKFDSMVADDVKVRVFGDTAIVTGGSTDKGTYKGQAFSGQFRWTDVFVKRDGKWQAVSSQVTKVSG